MSVDNTEKTFGPCKNPLLRRIHQLEAEAVKGLQSCEQSIAPKLGIDYLRDHIVEETRKRHPLATREEILEGMDAMGF
jgi:hypothetical protein